MRSPSTAAVAFLCWIGLVACGAEDTSGGFPFASSTPPTPSRLVNESGAELTIHIAPLADGLRLQQSSYAEAGYVPMLGLPVGPNTAPLPPGGEVSLSEAAWVGVSGVAPLHGVFIEPFGVELAVSLGATGLLEIHHTPSSTGLAIPAKIVPACAAPAPSKVSFDGDWEPRVEGLPKALVEEVATDEAGCVVVRFDEKRTARACIPAGAWPFPRGTEVTGELDVDRIGRPVRLTLRDATGIEVDLRRDPVPSSSLALVTTTRATCVAARPGLPTRVMVDGIRKIGRTLALGEAWTEVREGRTTESWLLGGETSIFYDPGFEYDLGFIELVAITRPAP